MNTTPQEGRASPTASPSLRGPVKPDNGNSPHSWTLDVSGASGGLSKKLKGSMHDLRNLVGGVFASIQIYCRDNESLSELEAFNDRHKQFVSVIENTLDIRPEATSIEVYFRGLEHLIVVQGPPEGGRSRQALGFVLGTIERVRSMIIVISENESKEEPTTIDWADLIDVTSQRSRTRFTEVAYRSDIRTERPFFGKPSELERLVLNLINNAAEATNKVEGQSGLVEISVSSNELGFIIEVSDNGCGMSEAQVAKLLAEGNFTTKTGEGHGIGV